MGGMCLNGAQGAAKSRIDGKSCREKAENSAGREDSLAVGELARADLCRHLFERLGDDVLAMDLDHQAQRR